MIRVFKERVKALLDSRRFQLALLVGVSLPITALLSLSKIVSLCTLAVFLLGGLLYPLHRRPKVVLGLYVIAVLGAISPVDMTFRNLEGPPRFVRVIYGIPGGNAFDTVDKGEAILAGCVVPLGSPIWVWVW